MKQQSNWSPYDNNGGTCVAIAGADYCVIAADTRMSTGYSILTRDYSKICQLAEKSVMASSGFQADVRALQKVLAARHLEPPSRLPLLPEKRDSAFLARKRDGNAILKRKNRAPKEDGSLPEQIGHKSTTPKPNRTKSSLVLNQGKSRTNRSSGGLSKSGEIYQHQHNKQMSCPAMAQLLSNTLYYKRFFPYYAFNVLGGLDNEGKGCVFTYDAVGSYERVGYSSQGSGSHTHHAFFGQPTEDAVTPLSELEAIDLVKTCFASATERDIYTGDKLEIVVLNADGIRREHMELRKD
ncbi:N-terminal nucleophile aminohydrolases (Ntn hydrolases) superfamily protein [Actinidia rufa]|uniref:Proteasome subunit beta n=2 Tax=Actinidia rufa TaxID=165716 RepID=A0A7J0F728_9ERIC|nr:N-terminal nucleophile aminohydrolases (Ntn hydrolases) superfamily protein [Actinidia rufa]